MSLLEAVEDKPLWNLWSIWDPALKEWSKPGGSNQRKFRMKQAEYLNRLFCNLKGLDKSFDFPEGLRPTYIFQIVEFIPSAHKLLLNIRVRQCDFEHLTASEDLWTLRAKAELGNLLALTLKVGDIVVILEGTVDQKKKRILLNEVDSIHKTSILSHIIHIADCTKVKPTDSDCPFGQKWAELAIQQNLRLVYSSQENCTILKTCRYIAQSKRKLPNQGPSTSTALEPFVKRLKTTGPAPGNQNNLDRVTLSQRDRERHSPRNSIFNIFSKSPVRNPISSKNQRVPSVMCSTPLGTPRRNPIVFLERIDVVLSTPERISSWVAEQETNTSRESRQSAMSQGSASILPGGFIRSESRRRRRSAHRVRRRIHESTDSSQEDTKAGGANNNKSGTLNVISPVPVCAVSESTPSPGETSRREWKVNWRPSMKKSKRYEINSLLSYRESVHLEPSGGPKRKVSVYGIVSQILQAAHPNSHRIRISDEEMVDVLVRIHPSATEGEGGPDIDVNDIIRIHRPTIQEEKTERGGDLEMVISTSALHNFVLFNFDPIPNARILSATVAKHISFSEEDRARIIELRNFISNRVIDPVDDDAETIDDDDLSTNYPDEDFDLSPFKHGGVNHQQLPNTPSPPKNRNPSPEVQNVNEEQNSSGVLPSEIGDNSENQASELSEAFSVDELIIDGNSVNGGALSLKDLTEDHRRLTMKFRILDSEYISSTEKYHIRVSDGTRTNLFTFSTLLDPVVFPIDDESGVPCVDILIRDIESNPDLWETFCGAEVSDEWILTNVKIIPREGDEDSLADLVVDALESTLRRHRIPNGLIHFGGGEEDQIEEENEENEEVETEVTVASQQPIEPTTPSPPPEISSGLLSKHCILS